MYQCEWMNSPMDRMSQVLFLSCIVTFVIQYLLLLWKVVNSKFSAIRLFETMDFMKIFINLSYLMLTLFALEFSKNCSSGNFRYFIAGFYIISHLTYITSKKSVQTRCGLQNLAVRYILFPALTYFIYKYIETKTWFAYILKFYINSEYNLSAKFELLHHIYVQKMLRALVNLLIYMYLRDAYCINMLDSEALSSKSFKKNEIQNLSRPVNLKAHLWILCSFLFGISFAALDLHRSRDSISIIFAIVLSVKIIRKIYVSQFQVTPEILVKIKPKKKTLSCDMFKQRLENFSGITRSNSSVAERSSNIKPKARSQTRKSSSSSCVKKD